MMPSENQPKSVENRVMRIEMDNKWSATELGSLLTNLSDLYSLSFILHLIRGNQLEEYLARSLPSFPVFRRRKVFLKWLLRNYILEGSRSLFSEYFIPDERLEVRRIKYSSPGVTDLTGIGAIVGHITDFILRLIEHHSTESQRSLENERRELENERIRLENAKSFLSILRDYGLKVEDMRELISYVDNKQDIIFQLVTSHKITGVYVMARNASEVQNDEA
jgi:hypothetical protein